MLDLVKGRLVQVQVILESRHVTWLLADDLRARILHDSGAMHSRLRFRSNKVLCRLADAPDAGVPLSGRTKQLDNLGRQHGGVEQEPALIEHRDTRLSGFA